MVMMEISHDDLHGMAESKREIEGVTSGLFL